MKLLFTSIIFTLGFFSPLLYQNFMKFTPMSQVLPMFFLLVGYGTYKLKFNKKNSFKNFIYRNYIKFKWGLQNINEKLQAKPENSEILPIQTKSIKLWKLLLRDDKSQISCSLGNKIRQIEKDNMLLILSPINQQDFQLTIMDVDNNKSCLYEIPIYSRLSENLIDAFDSENEKRMNEGQSEKRQSIHNDLDKLIYQQQESLRARSQIKN